MADMAESSSSSSAAPRLQLPTEALEPPTLQPRLQGPADNEAPERGDHDPLQLYEAMLKLVRAAAKARSRGQHYFEAKTRTLRLTTRAVSAGAVDKVWDKVVPKVAKAWFLFCNAVQEVAVNSYRMMPEVLGTTGVVVWDDPGFEDDTPRVPRHSNARRVLEFGT
mmetsp:Transcript_38720/g.101175  ORF Transcript_38720/g.101175 Transcript_38720/m.101175 type:complete len:165 (+) Transcript_38720:53-547(+)